MANLGGERPIEPLRACDKDEGPGPGTDVPDAPASGASLSVSVLFAIGICPRAEGDPGDAARRAVETAREGEPDRVDGARNEEEGIGLALGDSGGLSSVRSSRPAIFASVADGVESAEGRSSKFDVFVAGL